MLIIAIPKSASSSLITTLCLQHGLEDTTETFRQEFEGGLSIADDYKALKKWHSEFWDISDAWALATQSKHKLSKHHFPPTANNKQLLKNQKKVILLRKPEDVVRSYYRGHKTGSFEMQSEDFAFCFTETQWIEKAKRIGLIDELQRFYDGWLEDKGENLILYFDDIVHNALQGLNEIEDFWGLPRSRSVQLMEEKFSGSSKVDCTLPFRRAYRRLCMMVKNLILRVL